MPSSTPLRRVISRALRRPHGNWAASTILPQMTFGVVRILEQEVGELVGADFFDHRAHFARNQFVLGLRELNFGSEPSPTGCRSGLHAVVAGHLDLAFLSSSFEVMYLVMVRVIAARRPVRWVPPSRCGMLLVKH